MFTTKRLLGLLIGLNLVMVIFLWTSSTSSDNAAKSSVKKSDEDFSVFFEDIVVESHKQNEKDKRKNGGKKSRTPEPESDDSDISEDDSDDFSNIQDNKKSTKPEKEDDDKNSKKKVEDENQNKKNNKKNGKKNKQEKNGKGNKNQKKNVDSKQINQTQGPKEIDAKNENKTSSLNDTQNTNVSTVDNIPKSNNYLPYNVQKLDDYPNEFNDEKKYHGIATEEFKAVLQKNNVLETLGAYPPLTTVVYNSYPGAKKKFNSFMMGLKHDPNYCAQVDLYNLANPDNVFEKINFFSDYAGDEEIVRTDALMKIGNDSLPEIRRGMPKNVSGSRSYSFPINVVVYFTKRVDYHIYHKIGRHFLCASQMYGHIPGHGSIKRKDLVVDAHAQYAEKMKNYPQCFNPEKFMKKTFRMWNEQDCKEFFYDLNSQAYLDRQKENPIQYMMKKGAGAHQGSGVFILDANRTLHTKYKYRNGQMCGKIKKRVVAQTYMTNPLLLDRHNKFDFRIYLLIASTNPVIAYYHDGFAKLALETYDKFSTDKAIHLSNTKFAEKFFNEAKDHLVFNMTEEELRHYRVWTLEKLQDYLLNVSKITDKNWANNWLRPSFQKAFIHLVLMTQHTYWQGSNVFEMFGVDFMLDEDLNLWFIECNSSPQYTATNKYKAELMIKMLLDMFEIQFAYYRSRMLRTFRLISKFNEDVSQDKDIDYLEYKKKYIIASLNRLEPEFQLSPNNTFVPIIDMNRKVKGENPFFDYIPKECADAVWPM